MSKDNWRFSYAGVDLKPPDADGITFTLQPIDDAERNAEGDLFIQPIALKRTLTAKWSLLRGDVAQQILGALEANREGPLVFFNPITGSMDEMQAYYGAGVSASFMRYDDDMKKQLWSSLQVNFIEV